MSVITKDSTDIPLPVSLRRIAALSIIAGYVEVIGFMDIGGIYPGIMTGNTVQLGLTLAKAQWHRFGTVGLAVGLFFIGGILSSLIKRHLRWPPVELLIMAAILLVASVVRLDAPLRTAIELPLLALAMAMQGETIARFGGVSLQTIVVTNNMVKFSDALVGRYLSRTGSGSSSGNVPEQKEVLMPGLAWLSYSFGAGAGASAATWFRLPFLGRSPPAAIPNYSERLLLQTRALLRQQSGLVATCVIRDRTAAAGVQVDLRQSGYRTPCLR